MQNDQDLFNEMLSQIEAGCPTLDGPEVATAWKRLHTDVVALAAKIGREDELFDALCK